MITTLFLDVGGVLLTNGWDRNSRKLAVIKFGLDSKEMEARHAAFFSIYEEGKITLEEYLENVVFYRKRSFTMKEFQSFMFSQSKQLPDMLEFLIRLKSKYNLKIVAVSNEGRELAEYRILKFKLNKLVDFFICSSFVHVCKPDADIYILALDMAQVDPHQVVYIDDREMFVEVAENLGIHGIHHVDYDTTTKHLNALFLKHKGTKARRHKE